MVRRLLQDDDTATVEVDPTQLASTFHRALAAATPKAQAKAKAGEKVKVVKVEMYRKIPQCIQAVAEQFEGILENTDRSPVELHGCGTPSL